MLDFILSEYKKDIEKFISKVKGNILVLDFDGTLCKFKYTADDSERIQYCKQSDLDKAISLGLDFYKYAKPNKIVRYIVEQVGKSNVYVLGYDANLKNRDIKKDWLRVNDFRIDAKNCYFTDTAEDKQIVLRWLQNANPNRKIYFVDDNAVNTSYMEEVVPGVICVHTSMLMP